MIISGPVGIAKECLGSEWLCVDVVALAKKIHSCSQKLKLPEGKVSSVSLCGPFWEGLQLSYTRILPDTLLDTSRFFPATLYVLLWGVCVINGQLGFLLGSSGLTLEASDQSGDAEAPDSLFLLSLIQETKANRDFIGLHDPSFMEWTHNQAPWLSFGLL